MASGAVVLSAYLGAQPGPDEDHIIGSYLLFQMQIASGGVQNLDCTAWGKFYFYIYIFKASIVSLCGGCNKMPIHGCCWLPLEQSGQ